MTEDEKSGQERSRTKSFATGAEAFRWIAGDMDTDVSGAEEDLRWFDDLRGQLRRLRKARNLSQVELAGRLHRPQSEISRLENSLGPGSRLGNVRDYVRACGEDFNIVFGPSDLAGDNAMLEDATPEDAGRGLGASRGQGLREGLAIREEMLAVPVSVVESGLPGRTAQSRTGRSTPVYLEIEGRNFVGQEASVLLAVLRTLTRMLETLGFSEIQRRDLIRDLLEEMDRASEGDASAGFESAASATVAAEAVAQDDDS